MTPVAVFQGHTDSFGDGRDGGWGCGIGCDESIFGVGLECANA
jgi:hypothetical protein